MALDSKQKRGSAIDVGQPNRQWLLEPDGTISGADKQSLAKLCSGVAASGGSTGTIPRVVHHMKQQGMA